MLKLKNIEKNEFDEYVRNHKTKSHFLQSLSWGEFAKIKKNVTPYYLGLVNEKDEIVAATLLLEKKLILSPIDKLLSVFSFFSGLFGLRKALYFFRLYFWQIRCFFAFNVYGSHLFQIQRAIFYFFKTFVKAIDFLQFFTYTNYAQRR